MFFVMSEIDQMKDRRITFQKWESEFLKKEKMMLREQLFFKEKPS